MPGTLLIRDYVSADWEAVAHIHDNARLDELWLTIGVQAFRALEETAAEKGLFDGWLCVAEQDGVVAGFIAVTGDEVGWLYTDPDRYRQGIGRGLLRHALARLEANAVTVSVLVGNDPALSLYRSEGFEIVETREGMLQGSDDIRARGHVLRRAQG